MKQIIAMGGGGFSMEPDNPLLDQYILQQSAVKTPRICFLATASGDAEGYIKRYYDAFEKHNCIPSHLSLFKLPTSDIEGFLLDKDIIYVGGGNTKSMMALWREWGVDTILRKAWNKGIILSGLSAGSICWFEEGVTDSYSAELDVINGLGFLKGSHTPHYDGEERRRPTYKKLIGTKQIQGGLAADDGVALHFINTKLYQAVCSKMKAKAYRVTFRDTGALEEMIATKYLGD